MLLKPQVVTGLILSVCLSHSLSLCLSLPLPLPLYLYLFSLSLSVSLFFLSLPLSFLHINRITMSVTVKTTYSFFSHSFSSTHKANTHSHRHIIFNGSFSIIFANFYSLSHNLSVSHSLSFFSFFLGHTISVCTKNSIAVSFGTRA